VQFFHHLGSFSNCALLALVLFWNYTAPVLDALISGAKSLTKLTKKEGAKSLTKEYEYKLYNLRHK